MQDSNKTMTPTECACRFSVITPTFNRAHLLPRCITSVSKQTLEDFEQIVVDDGSTDSTEQIVNSFRITNGRLKYISQTNQGANVARNLGCKEAIGEYYLFLDSDDEAQPHWLEHLAALIVEHGRPAVVCCGIEFYDSSGNLAATKTPAVNNTGAGGLYNSGTYAIRHDVFENIGGFAATLAAHQHSELKLRLLAWCRQTNERVACTPQTLVRAHQHDGPNIRSDTRAKLESTKFILREHRDKFEKPSSIAAWLAAAGGCAAELDEYGEAREFFGEAVTTCPKYWKNYLRWTICWLPIIRRRFWRQTGTPRT